MLEVVDVTAGINRHVIIFMEYRKKALLHVESLVLLLASLGVDRMMAYHDNPVFLGILQSFVEPGELSLSILLTSIRIDFRILAVRINKGRGVEEDDAHGGSFVVDVPELLGA